MVRSQYGASILPLLHYTYLLFYSFIPEETKISVAMYSIQRDPRYFSPHPEEFWPDRWLTPESRMSFQDPSKHFGTQMDVILDHDAFMPFSSGHRNCVGKGLAMNEMRVVVSYIVQRFDMKPAPGYDLDQWEKELQDFYVMKKGHLPVGITARA
jgi:cytochrome P450